MQSGPLQIIFIGFNDDEVTTEQIMGELRALHEHDIIHMLDIIFIRKSDDGEVSSYTATSLYDDESLTYGLALKRLLGLEGEVAEIAPGEDGNAYGLSAAEVRALVERMPNSSAASVLLFEHTWAAPLGALVADAGGWLMAQGLLTRDAVVVMGDELKAIAAAEASIVAAAAVRGAVILDTLAFVEEVEANREELAAAVATRLSAEVLRSLIGAGVISNDEVETAVAALVHDGLLDVDLVQRALAAGVAAEARHFAGPQG